MRRYAFLCLGAALAATPAFGQNLVFNGSFEDPAIGSAGWQIMAPGVTFGGWLAGGSGVALVGTFQNPPAFDGLQSVELNNLDPGDVSQTIATTAGQSYLLSFEMAGQMNAGPDIKTMDVLWNDTVIDSPTWVRSIQQGQWQIHQYVVQASGSSSALKLAGTVFGDGGPYVDDVQLTPVPEPASVLILGGLLGLSCLRKRRR